MLSTYFMMMNLPETPVNESEMKRADAIKIFLTESINKYTGIEVVEDKTLDFQEQFKKKAVEYWRSGKTKNLNIRTVTHRFRKVISKAQFKR